MGIFPLGIFPLGIFPLGTLRRTGLNAAMETPPPRLLPSLATLFVSFAGIGMVSFGGGLTAWIRREVVQKRAWLDDQQFLSGYALSQLVPGATNVNLAVFIGTQMRGSAGALACLAGLTALPVALVLLMGVAYLRLQSGTGSVWLSGVLAGMGAVAIGLNLGTGVRLAVRNIRGLVPVLITAAVTVGIGVLGFSLVAVLLVMLPVSLVATWLTTRPTQRLATDRPTGLPTGTPAGPTQNGQPSRTDHG